MPESHLLAVKEVARGPQHSSPEAASFLVPQRGQKPGFGMGDHVLGK